MKHAAKVLDRCDGNHDLAQLAVAIGAQLGQETGDSQGFPANIAGVLEGNSIDLARQKLRQQQDAAEHEAQDSLAADLHAEYHSEMKRRAEQRLADLAAEDRERIIDEGFSAYVKDYEWYIDRQRWDRARARKWATEKILDRWSHDGEPKFGEWREGREV